MANYTLSNNTYLATPKDDPKDLIQVEIGDSKEPSVILPQQKISRWDNEVNVSIRLLDFNEYSVFQDREKVIFGNDTKEVHIYPITEGEGGQEFEVILNEKPLTNVIQFTLQTKGLNFYRQPSLLDEIKVGDGEADKTVALVTDTDAFNADGKVLTHRPENVVGSYAVYASENKFNYIGGKEYKCGKFGHIYRPKIIDSVGTEVWGELNIENEILSVTIPQEFLDKAIYPIRHSAGLEIGYSSIGAADSNNYAWNTRIYATGDTTLGGAGTGVAAYIYGRSASGTSNVQIGIYDTSDPSNKIANSNSPVIAITTNTLGWWTSNYVTAPTFTAVQYYTAFIGDDNWYSWGSHAYDRYVPTVFSLCHICCWYNYLYHIYF
jgi:hypothetical protein